MQAAASAGGGREPIPAAPRLLRKGGPVRALLIVDVQNDFIDGSLAVPRAAEIIPVINRLRHKGFDVVFQCLDWHPCNHCSFRNNNPGSSAVFQVVNLPNTGDAQVMWPDHCVQGTRGAELHKDLLVEPSDVWTYAGCNPVRDSYSVFKDNGSTQLTDIADSLRSAGVTEIYAVGLATDYCVQYSVLDAKTLLLGVEVFFVSDGCRGIGADTCASALKKFEYERIRVVSSDGPEIGALEDRKIDPRSGLPVVNRRTFLAGGAVAAAGTAGSSMSLLAQQHLEPDAVDELYETLVLAVDGKSLASDEAVRAQVLTLLAQPAAADAVNQLCSWSQKNALHACCESGDLAALRVLVAEAGPLINLTARTGKLHENALMLAVTCRRVEVRLDLVSALLAAASPEQRQSLMFDQTAEARQSALMLACREGDCAVVELLLQYDASVGQLQLSAKFGTTAIMYACMTDSERHCTVTEMLLASQHTDELRMELLGQRDSELWSALHFGAKTGSFAGVDWERCFAGPKRKWWQELYSIINTPTSSGITFLHLAAFNGKTEVVRVLLHAEHAGAAGGLGRRAGRGPDDGVQVKLRWMQAVSAATGSAERQAVLVNVRVRATGDTELDLAMQRGHLETARVLLRLGCHAGSSSSAAMTELLHRLVLMGDVDGCESVLCFADENGITVDETLVELTQRMEHPEACTFSFASYNSTVTQFIYRCELCLQNVCLVCKDRCHGRGACRKALGALDAEHNPHAGWTALGAQNTFCGCSREQCCSAPATDERELEGYRFLPNPINTTGVKLSAALAALGRRIARNNHNVWARQKVQDGWQFARDKNEQLKHHPLLTPFSALSYEGQKYNLDMASETIKVIDALGYEITEPASQRQVDLPARPRGLGEMLTAAVMARRPSLAGGLGRAALAAPAEAPRISSGSGGATSSPSRSPSAEASRELAHLAPSSAGSPPGLPSPAAGSPGGLSPGSPTSAEGGGGAQPGANNGKHAFGAGPKLAQMAWREELGECQVTDTSAINLPSELDALVELLAINSHEVWASEKIRQGFRFAPARNIKVGLQLNNSLVPYELLSDNEKQLLAAGAVETVKLILQAGFTITPPPPRPDEQGEELEQDEAHLQQPSQQRQEQQALEQRGGGGEVDSPASSGGGSRRARGWKRAKSNEENATADAAAAAATGQRPSKPATLELLTAGAKRKKSGPSSPSPASAPTPSTAPPKLSGSTVYALQPKRRLPAGTHRSGVLDEHTNHNFAFRQLKHSRRKLFNHYLFAAVRRGQIDSVNILLTKRTLTQAGANLNAIDGYGHTPLYIAVKRGHLDAAMRLLALGANVDIRDVNGLTPLSLAAYLGNLRLCTELVASDARILVHDNMGFTPLHLAASEGHVGVVRYLTERLQQEYQTNDIVDLNINIRGKLRHGLPKTRRRAAMRLPTARGRVNDVLTPDSPPYKEGEGGEEQPLREAPALRPALRHALRKITTLMTMRGAVGRSGAKVNPADAATVTSMQQQLQRRLGLGQQGDGLAKPPVTDSPRRGCSGESSPRASSDAGAGPRSAPAKDVRHLLEDLDELACVSPLTLALRGNRIDVVVELIAHGGDPMQADGSEATGGMLPPYFRALHQHIVATHRVVSVKQRIARRLVIQVENVSSAAKHTGAGSKLGFMEAIFGGGGGKEAHPSTPQQQQLLRARSFLQSDGPELTTRELDAELERATADEHTASRMLDAMHKSAKVRDWRNWFALKMFVRNTVVLLAMLLTFCFYVPIAPDYNSGSMLTWTSELSGFLQGDLALRVQHEREFLNWMSGQLMGDYLTRRPDGSAALLEYNFVFGPVVLEVATNDALDVSQSTFFSHGGGIAKLEARYEFQPNGAGLNGSFAAAAAAILASQSVQSLAVEINVYNPLLGMYGVVAITMQSSQSTAMEHCTVTVAPYRVDYGRFPPSRPFQAVLVALLVISVFRDFTLSTQRGALRQRLLTAEVLNVIFLLIMLAYDLFLFEATRILEPQFTAHDAPYVSMVRVQELLTAERVAFGAYLLTCIMPLLKAAQTVPHIGPIVVAIVNTMLHEAVVMYMAVISVIGILLAVAFSTVYGSVLPVFSTLLSAFQSIFLSPFIDTWTDAIAVTSTGGMGELYGIGYILYATFTLNLLIAVMSDIYPKEREQSDSLWDKIITDGIENSLRDQAKARWIPQAFRSKNAIANAALEIPYWDRTLLLHGKDGLKHWLKHGEGQDSESSEASLRRFMEAKVSTLEGKLAELVGLMQNSAAPKAK